MRTKLSNSSRRSIPAALVVLGAGLRWLSACSSPNAPSDGSGADAIDDGSTRLDARSPDAVVSDIADAGAIDPDSASDAGTSMDAADDDANSADALAADSSDVAADAEMTDGSMAADATNTADANNANDANDANDANNAADARDASAVTDVADVPDAAPLCAPAADPLRIVDLSTTQRIAIRTSSTVTAVSAGSVAGGLVIDSGARNAYFVGRAPTPRSAACFFAEQIAPNGWVTTWCPDQLVSPTAFVANRLAALGATTMLPASMARMSMGQVAYSTTTGAFVVSSSDVATSVLAAEGPSVIAPSATSALVDECLVGVAPPSPKVDIVFVVDNTASMGPYLDGLARVTTGFFDRLTRAGVDWRAAAVDTSYYSAGRPSDTRVFTTSPSVAQCWFTRAPAAGMCVAANERWFGLSGSTDERGLQSAHRFIRTALTPATAIPQDTRLRQGAQLVLIVLGDADDQWIMDPAGSIATLSTFFNDYDGAGSAAVVHTIVCPEIQTCGETQYTPRRFRAISDATRGIKFAIGDLVSTTQDPTRLIAADIIAHAGPLAPTNTLGHSVRSSGATCTPTTAPHDGFAWFSNPRARLGTSLSCRPSPGDATRVGLARWSP